jgi:CheY-like chemotaxis protein
VTILVVEDEFLVRFDISDCLRRADYRVLDVPSAEKAMAVFTAGEAVNILISDIYLGPGMDGVQLATWVRSNFPDVRILLTSGWAVAEDASPDGVVFVPKPYTHDQLLLKLRYP